jgi:hypothetical protein
MIKRFRRIAFVTPSVAMRLAWPTSMRAFDRLFGKAMAMHDIPTIVNLLLLFKFFICGTSAPLLQARSRQRAQLLP